MNLTLPHRLMASPRNLLRGPYFVKKSSSWDITNLSMNEAYDKTKLLCFSKKLPPDVNVTTVFPCNELDLSEVKVYGFDYDYTLANYKSSLDKLLYNLARETLIKKLKYPAAIYEMPYDPSFPIRGLHYDIEKGLLMKLDSFLQIQLGTVYRGLKSIPDEEVLAIYRNRAVPLSYVEGTGKSTHYLSSKMVQLADLFSVPEMCLLCNVAQFFEDNKIEYHPEILFYDVKNSMGSSHPVMHQVLQDDVEKYLDTNPSLREFFKIIKSAGKTLFLVTNSPYKFVNKGMNHLFGPDWEQFFDVIIVQARKPRFFTDESRPLRIYDKDTNTHLWDRVTVLKKGYIYYEGTIKILQELTGWRGREVLYFGDHPYSDLADVTLVHGWRTGAIIAELSHEIKMLNKSEFKANCNWLQMLSQLIEDCQDRKEPNSADIMAKWLKERDHLRLEIKHVFNKQFGSVFRTYHNPTYFSRRLFRFADIYTSNLSNLMNYSVKHTFYPRRGVMPHEYTSYFV